MLPPVGYCCHCAAIDAGSAIASTATTTAHDKAPRRRTPLEAMGRMVSKGTAACLPVSDHRHDGEPLSQSTAGEPNLILMATL